MEAVLWLLSRQKEYPTVETLSLLLSVWNDTHSYLSAVQTSEKWKEGARCREKSKKDQSEPNVALQASAGNRKKQNKRSIRWSAKWPSSQTCFSFFVPKLKTTQLPLIWCFEEKMAFCYLHLL